MPLTQATIHISMAPNWTAHKQTWKNCTDCDLCEHRRKVVLYRGALPCEVLYIGEAPGETEDAMGYPMVGPTRPIVEDIHDSVVECVMEHRMSTDVPYIPHAITNIVACRTPSNRDPYKAEMLACKPRLDEQVLFAGGYVRREDSVILPRKLLWAPKLKVIVLMGNVAGDNFTLPKGHYHRPKIVRTVHPAHIIRQQRDGLESSVIRNTRQAVRDIFEAYITR